MSHAGEQDMLVDVVEMVESRESERDMPIEEMVEVGDVKKCECILLL